MIVVSINKNKKNICFWGIETYSVPHNQTSNSVKSHIRDFATAQPYDRQTQGHTLKLAENAVHDPVYRRGRHARTRTCPDALQVFNDGLDERQLHVWRIRYGNVLSAVTRNKLYRSVMEHRETQPVRPPLSAHGAAYPRRAGRVVKDASRSHRRALHDVFVSVHAYFQRTG